MDISYFGRYTEQSNDTCQNAEKPENQWVISSLNYCWTKMCWTGLTSCCDCLLHKITSSHLRPLDDLIWDMLQELVYEGWRQSIEPNANLHELEKAISKKWNEIEDLKYKESCSLVQKVHVSSYNRTGVWVPFRASSVKHLLGLLMTK